MTKTPTEQQRAERAAIQQMGLFRAQSDARFAARKISPTMATVRIIEDIAKQSFQAGIEAQSDALQSEFTAYDRRISELEHRLAYLERVRSKIHATAFLS